MRAPGADVAGEDYGHLPWQEAFVRPDPVTGVVGDRASLGPIRLATPDVDAVRDLLGYVVGGEVRREFDRVRLSWPRSAVVVEPGEKAGVRAVDLKGGPPNGVRIGSVTIGDTSE